MDNDELSGSYKSHIDFKPRLHLENGLPLEISEGTKSPVHIWCSTAHWINVFKNSWLNPRATRHLYEIHANPQPPSVNDVLAGETVVELARFQEFL